MNELTFTFNCLTYFFRVPDAIKKHHDQGNSYQGRYLIRLVYRFRGLVHYHHGKKHGGAQADVVLEISTSGWEESRKRETLDHFKP